MRELWMEVGIDASSRNQPWQLSLSPLDSAVAWESQNEKNRIPAERKERRGERGKGKRDRIECM